MSNWFLIALIAPVLWSINTHTDKYFLSKYFNGGGTGAVFLFSSLFSVVIVAVTFFFTDHKVFTLSSEHLAILLFVGLTSALGFYSYLQALNQEEATVVVPFLQLVPVFGYVFGVIFLGESLTVNQLLAVALIVAGLVIISLEFEVGEKVRFKGKFMLPILASAFFFALHDVLFKVVAIEEDFVLSIFWQYVGLAVIGLFVFTFVPKYRAQFFELFKDHREHRSFIGLNVISEILYIIGNIANNFATLLAPVVLVLVVSSYQPLFVFAGGVFIAAFFPKIATERLSRGHLLQKALAIAVVCVGSYMLYYF